MHLTKHHGLANDFIVVLDEPRGHVAGVDGALARRLCDRRRGIGADGLIHGEQPPSGSATDVDVVMHLYNSDGSRAEMSGNGIRCLAQALAGARGLSEAAFVVASDAGPRGVAVSLAVDPYTSLVSVDLGAVGPGPGIPPEVAGRLDGYRISTAGLGNPHLVVVVDDPDAIDLAVEGPWLEAHFSAGINVEFIAVAAADTLTMRVWERGAGITAACGTGACAAAHVARDWGMVGDLVRVDMAGGTAEVQLGETVTLAGPVVRIAAIEVADV